MKSAEKYFDESARFYDSAVSSFKWQVHVRLANLLSSFSGGRPLRVVLDFGVGTGLLAEEVLKVHPHAKVVGVDVSNGMLDVLRKKGLGVDCFQYEGGGLPVPHGFYDAVVSSGVFEFVKNPEDEIQKIAAVMRPRGFLCMAWLCKIQGGGWRGWLKNMKERIFRVAFYPHPGGAMHRLLERSGFEILFFEEVEGLKYPDGRVYKYHIAIANKSLSP